MKYLKRFFESFDENELRDFCETHLVYLLDEGYELHIGDERGNKTISITIPSDVSNEDGEYDNGEFEWNNIKDHFIPFLTHLNNKYNIVPFSGLDYDKDLHFIEFFTNRPNQTWKYYTIKEVIDDKPSELNCYLYEITIKIKPS